MNDVEIYVPITEQVLEDGSKVTTIHILGEIIEPLQYAQAIHVLQTALSTDTVIINLNTEGGRLDTTTMICDAMEHTEAMVLSQVTGPVASAGTIIALAADDLRVAKWGSMMFHNASSGVWPAKGHEVLASVKFTIPHTEKLLRTAYKHFLTGKEIDYLIRGGDLYLAKEDIEARWQTLLEHRRKTFEQQEKLEESRQIEDAINQLIEQGYSVKSPKTK